MMDKKKVSIYDIAKELKISASTVSRALNNHKGISSEVSEAVHKLAKELNYKPNQLFSLCIAGRKWNSFGYVRS